jgi:hypothetical protein
MYLPKGGQVGRAILQLKKWLVSRGIHRLNGPLLVVESSNQKGSSLVVESTDQKVR